MIRLHIHSPDASHEVELNEGEAVLVGRDPLPDFDAELAGMPSPTRRVVIGSSLVSGRHALVWLEGGEVRARDLRSRNGTYLRVERDTLVTSRGAGEAHLHLAALKPSSRSAALASVSVGDGGSRGFGERIEQAAAEWLRRAGLSPKLEVVGPDADSGAADKSGPERFTIPLVDGLKLIVADEDRGRTAVDWEALKVDLFLWAWDQCAAFLSLRAARLNRPLAFRSPLAERALREVLDAAQARLPLVLSGESGTGKTALAAIYAGREWRRPTRGAAAEGHGNGPPFVTVHCAHLEAALAHSLLFGACKGSYTSSDRTVLGAVHLADGGVLFLDDVDALAPEVQAKLLRFLDQGEFEPLGHGRREPLHADVRVVAGTNANLRLAVRQGRFREDLYWRLHSGVVVRVPPLRERPEDVEQLLRDSPDFTALDGERDRAGGGRPSRSVLDRLDAGARELVLARHPWRGNFRECLRFCARVAMEPPSRPLLDRRRCEEILAETTLDEEPRGPAVDSRADDGGGPFERSLREALAWWSASEGGPPERFDDLQRFCESYLKSSFVAHTLGLAGTEERPESFDRDARLRLGCDLSTLKRKVDDYVALKRSIAGPDPIR